MVFGGTVLNNHAYFSEHPIVGEKSSTFRQMEQGHEPERIGEMFAADIAFSYAAPEQPEIMRKAVRSLGLDFAAIDFSTFADGSIVLWEANPYFDLAAVKKCMLWKERDLAGRNHRYVDAMAMGLAHAVGIGRA
jgi:hypothetical protein